MIVINMMKRTLKKGGESQEFKYVELGHVMILEC